MSIINPYELLTGVGTVDLRKISPIESEKVSGDLAVFPDNMGMTQGFYLDLGNPEDRALLTIGGGRIMIVHADTRTCLALAARYRGNIINVARSDGNDYCFWATDYNKEAYEQIISFMIDNPHDAEYIRHSGDQDSAAMEFGDAVDVDYEEFDGGDDDHFEEKPGWRTRLARAWKRVRSFSRRRQ